VSEYINHLKSLIERNENCQASRVSTVPVTELFEGKIAWTGKVEVFELTGHPRAKRCYAWGDMPYDTTAGRETRPGSASHSLRQSFTIVLEIPPVISAETAVKVAIASASRRAKSDEN
jgi:hypothetical protein